MILPVIIIILVLVCAYFEYQKKLTFNNKVIIGIICVLTFVISCSFIKKYNLDESEENFQNIENLEPDELTINSPAYGDDDGDDFTQTVKRINKKEARKERFVDDDSSDEFHNSKRCSKIVQKDNKDANVFAPSLIINRKSYNHKKKNKNGYYSRQYNNEDNNNYDNENNDEYSSNINVLEDLGLSTEAAENILKVDNMFLTLNAIKKTINNNQKLSLISPVVDKIFSEYHNNIESHILLDDILTLDHNTKIGLYNDLFQKVIQYDNGLNHNMNVVSENYKQFIEDNLNVNHVPEPPTDPTLPPTDPALEGGEGGTAIGNSFFNTGNMNSQNIQGQQRQQRQQRQQGPRRPRRQQNIDLLPQRSYEKYYSKEFVPGYSFTPPEFWNVPQQRAPVCLPQKQNNPSAVFDSSVSPMNLELNQHGDMAITEKFVTKTNVGSILPKFKYEEYFNDTCYR
jgi:hypothetical protein